MATAKLLNSGTCQPGRLLCVTCRKRSEEVLIRVQTSLAGTYCPGINQSATYEALNPPLGSYLIDVEMTWNARMSADQAKITDAMVKDVPSTTDLLCSPGKYSDHAWKHDHIYQGWGPTFKGGSNLPKEAIGFATDGTLLVQALTDDGQDPIFPVTGTR